MLRSTMLFSGLLLITALLACCVLAPRSTGQPGNGPVAWYRFEAAELGQDDSGNGLIAQVNEARPAEGRTGRGLLLDGKGGVEAAAADRLHAGQGFALEMWVRFSNVAANMGIFNKDGEYLLRIDPPAEGGNISFYVNAGGSLEPRVRGPVPQPDVWYHLVATWDGNEAQLWVNGQSFRGRRAGRIEPANSPVLIGKPSHFGPVGLQGVIDEVKLYARPLTDRDVLAAEYGLEEPVPGERMKTARFEFGADLQGWEARDADGLAVRNGKLQAALRGGASRLLNRRLDVPVRNLPYVSLRMAVDRGATGELAYLTTAGLVKLTFPLLADGRMHSYVLQADRDPEWDGNLRALCLGPSDAAARVEVDFLRVAAQPEAPAELCAERFLPAQAVNRAGRPCALEALVRNVGGGGKGLTATLALPGGADTQVRPYNGGPVGADLRVRPQQFDLAHGETRTLSWQVQADQPVTGDVKLTLSGPEVTPTTATFPLVLSPRVNVPKAAYVPEPQVAPSDTLVGCHYCPLWKQGSRSGGWQEIVPFPEREPVLGWYDEGSPEVADWEIKWCLEHGIQYFVYCWYRTNQGHPVEQALGHAIHEGLFHARYRDKFKFTIMWENQSKGSAGVASEEDLMTNLLPYWIENYFKHPSYLKIDNKPLLFIYRPEFLVDDLGSVANVRRALDKMRAACKQAGFAGLTILGEYRGTDPRPLQLMVDEGLDYSFAYCWPVPNQDAAPPAAVAAQESFWQSWQQQNVIPFLLTASMGWDSTPWSPSYSIWRLPPADFRTLCERAKTFMGTLPESSLGRKLLLLDNWNEFGEGHYIAPHRQYGFGYLDAVRSVFTHAPEPHIDLIPEDVGLGPYDSLFRQTLAFENLRSKRVNRVGPATSPVPSAWWSFDEDDGTPVAFDDSGHGAGGLVHDATRAPGHQGKALVCNGGCVEVPGNAIDLPTRAITIECWVKTDVADQTDKWFVNNVYDGGESGFRLGLSGGRLAWAIPKTAWSHQLVADAPLPLGQWVHVAATYDGQTMRLTMNGKLCGSLDRGGRINSTTSHLCLGSYDIKHKAFFSGLLDEVRVYPRALTEEEVGKAGR